MSTFARATDKKYAALTLALCFETLGDLDDPKLTEKEAELIGAVAGIGAEQCGEQLTEDGVSSTLDEFQMWWSQDHVQPVHAFDSLIAAAATLKEHWKTGKDGHVHFLMAVMALGAVDGEISETEKPLPGLICGVMGIEQATYDRARKELFGR